MSDLNQRFLVWLKAQKKGAPASECVRRFRGIDLRDLEHRGSIVYKIGRRCGDRWFVR